MEKVLFSREDFFDFWGEFYMIGESFSIFFPFIMKRLLFSLFLLSLPITSFAASVSDRIEMGVSPIRYEFTVDPGVPLMKTIIFYNNADIPYTLYLTAEDCRADSLVGTPKCQISPNVTWDPLYASTWINFGSNTGFTVPPKSERQITFTVTPPTNAIPGGHYGAIFFNNPTGGAGGNTVTMLKRIGTLLLITVPGEITYNTTYGGIEVGNGGGWGAWGRGVSWVANSNGYPTPVSTPAYWLNRMSDILDPTLSAPTLSPTKNFGVDFKIPVKNTGNIHILPVGRIEIIDENGLPLKSIGKESIRSPEWAFIWEKIVDYLPVNDEGGNVLPGSDRLFTISWKWFAYETIDGGKSVIKFLPPQEHYKQEQSNQSPYLLPWEKYRVVSVSKVLKAKVYIEYKGANNTPVPYETEEDIAVDYQVLEKSINYGAILILVWALLLIWVIKLLLWWGRRIDLLEEEVGYLEAEVDELEKGRILAQKVLAKKKEKNNTETMIDQAVESAKWPKKSTSKVTPIKKSTSKKVPTKK
jgi:hypothetical protein